MIITFAGHRSTYSQNLSAQLRQILSALVQKEPEVLFYTGGMGNFDELAASIIRQLQREHPYIHLALVLPYMTNRINTDREYYEKQFDEIILPLDSKSVHYKSAITLRNRWMIDHADIIIAYVNRNFGGAFTTLQYALKKKKPVINLACPDVNQIFTCIFQNKRL